MPGPRLDRRRFLRTAAAVIAFASTAGVPDLAAAGSGGGPSARNAAVRLRWLGTAGWRIDVGSRTLLVDPYLSRFHTGEVHRAFDPATKLTVDADAVTAHVGSPETVLVTHSHWDHFNDVPHIAHTSGARVVGTMTTYHLALAYGVTAAQLSPVKGGEVLDFGSYVVEVIAALHSRNAGYSMAFPGVRLSPPERPKTIAELPEGDTLAFQVTVKDGPSVSFMGGSDFVERNLSGLAPDVAMIAMPSSDATHAYVPRLIDALDRPATVIPVHWDNFESPLRNPPPITANDAQRLDAFRRAVRKAAPGSKILTPEYLTPYAFPDWGRQLAAAGQKATCRTSVGSRSGTSGVSCQPLVVLGGRRPATEPVAGVRHGSGDRALHCLTHPADGRLPYLPGDQRFASLAGQGDRTGVVQLHVEARPGKSLDGALGVNGVDANNALVIDDPHPACSARPAKLDGWVASYRA